MTAPRTSTTWWEHTKADPAKLNHWLQRQYVGEIAAVNLLSELLIRFGSDATAQEWDTVHKIMCQEAVHGKWVKELMVDRGVLPEKDANAERRYWAEVLPNVNSFAEAMAAGFHAESMRLARIRAIAQDEDPNVADISAVFKRILPQEEWHERAFNEMRKGRELTKYHARGLQALNLILA